MTNLATIAFLGNSPATIARVAPGTMHLQDSGALLVAKRWREIVILSYSPKCIFTTISAIFYFSTKVLYLKSLLTDSFETLYAYVASRGIFKKINKHDPVLSFKMAAIQNCSIQFTLNQNFTKNNITYFIKFNL